MQFDPSHKPSRENLSPEIAALMDKTFYRRREAGLNVQFVHRESGRLDEWSFKDREQAEGFSRRLSSEGIDHVFSA